jgi:hypothetical protein
MNSSCRELSLVEHLPYPTQTDLAISHSLPSILAISAIDEYLGSMTIDMEFMCKEAM